MWIIPAIAETSSLWDTLKSVDIFTLQRYNQDARQKSVWAALQNVLQTKQPPYRILIHGQTSDTLVSSGALEDTARDWEWIETVLIPELSTLTDKSEKESYAAKRITSLVPDADQKSTDVKFKAACRSWRQVFKLPDTERFVNCIHLLM